MGEGRDSFEALGVTLRHMRDRQQGREGRPGMSQTALARRLGVHRAVVVVAEQGRVSARTATLYDDFYDTGGVIYARREKLARVRARRGRRKAAGQPTAAAGHEGDDGFEAFGRWLRALRGDTTQGTLARRLGVSQSVVSNAERGFLTEPTAARYDTLYTSAGATAKGEIPARWHTLLDERDRAEERAAAEEESRHAPPAPAAPGQAPTPPKHPATLGDLLAVIHGGRTLSLPEGPYQVMTSTGEVVVVAIDRRLFVAGAGLVVPAVGTEASRQGLLRSLVGDGWGNAEEWQAIVAEHHATYYTVTPAERFARLSADLAALGEAAGHERGEAGRGELRKAGAFLASLMSSTAADLGDLPGGARWARAARQAADASGDLHTRLFVRGREVAMGLYQRRPLVELLHTAEEGVAIGEAQGPPRTSAWPRLLGATAQTLAMVGRRDDATLAHARDGFDAMPDSLRDSSLSSYAEHNLRYSEGYVYTYAGEYGKADAAQAAALRLYPPEYHRGPAQVEVMRALCLVRVGDTAAGVAHARDTIGKLPPAHRVRAVIDLGRKVLDAVPAGERDRDGVREFEVYLGGHEAA